MKCGQRRAMPLQSCFQTRQTAASKSVARTKRAPRNNNGVTWGKPARAPIKAELHSTMKTTGAADAIHGRGGAPVIEERPYVRMG